MKAGSVAMSPRTMVNSVCLHAHLRDLPSLGVHPWRSDVNRLASIGLIVVLLKSALLLSGASAQSPDGATGPSAEKVPPVTAPPDSFFDKVREQDRNAASRFYKKYLDVKGMPVVASADVADEALQRTYFIVTHLLAGRPDILEAMAKNGTRLIIIGKDQVYTDMPEYRNHPNPASQNQPVRGTACI